MPTLRPRAWAKADAVVSGGNSCINSFADMIAFDLSCKDGSALASHLSLLDVHCKNLFNSLNQGWNLVNSRQNGGWAQPLISNHKPWADQVSNHISAIVYLNDRGEDGSLRPDWINAYQCQLKFVNWFGDYIRAYQEASGWLLPLLYTCCRQLKRLAIEADMVLVSRGEKPKYLQDAATGPLKKGWLACTVADRDASFPESRKQGAMYMATLLFKCYFKLKTPKLCRNVINGMEAHKLAELNLYRRPHQVTYKYYIGLLAFLNEDYKAAESHFEFAFLNCHRKSMAQRELILTYLIPIRLMKGRLPSQGLLRAFPRHDLLFAPFVKAIRSGNVNAFDAALNYAELRLLERGTYLAVEASRDICIRGLLQLVWKLRSNENRTRLPVEAVKKALLCAHVQLDSEQTECLLANMIAKGFVKGYISNERQMVVLSAKEPFPQLQKVQRV